VVDTGALNSERMRADLAGLDPDVLVLGGIGILSEAILRIPRLGVLNSHAALLPWVRGNGVVGRSLQRSVPVGCTLHYVAEKVDAGGIVDRRLVELDADLSLRELERRADELAAAMMVDAVASVVETGSGPAAVPQQETFPVSRRLSWLERRAVNREARRGRARELFESWKTHTLDGEDYRLASDFDPGSL
jgi:methionyl-tRNA formyltransferase